MDKKTYINVGTNGTFKASGNHQYDTLPSDVDAIIKHLKDNNKGEIAFYFHGGLVSDNAGIQSAKIMNDQIIKTGLHPISFIWETGMFEVLRDGFKEVSGKTLYKIVQRIILRRLKSRLSLEKNKELFDNFSLTQIDIELNKENPFDGFEVNLAQLEKDVEAHKDLSDYENIENITKEIEKDVSENSELLENLDYSELDELTLDQEFLEGQTEKEKTVEIGFFWSIAKITYRIIKRYLKKTNHYFYATLIEEILRRYYVAKIGSYVWKEMKDKAHDMWNPNEGRQGANLYAGTYLLSKLNEIGTPKNPIVINAIGHSAGSIAICHMTRKVSENYPNIKVNNLLLLAPACRSELFNEQIVQKTDGFNEIRIFTMSNEYERKDRLLDGFGIVYPHSLLYFISGILEDKGRNPDAHILGLERHINWKNYLKHSHLKSIHTYLNEPEKKRLVLSVTSANDSGISSNAIDHAEFDNNPRTLNSIVHVLKNGLN